MPYAIRKLKIFFLIFVSLLPGVCKIVKTHHTQKMKIIARGSLIAQIKRVDALITTKKTQISARTHFFKNQDKPPKILSF